MLVDYIYNDIDLTDQFDDATDVLGVQAVNGASDYGVFYIGTPTSGNQLQDQAAPGSGSITVSIVDASPGTGVEAAHIKLATSVPNLATAVAGDPLAVATTILYGAPAAVYYQWDNSVLTGTDESSELSLQVSTIAESAQ